MKVKMPDSQGAAMSATTVDIERLFAERSESEIVSSAAKLLAILKRKYGGTDRPFEVKDAQNREIFYVHSTRPGYLIESDEELIAEAERRSADPNAKFVAADEMMAFIERQITTST